MADFHIRADSVNVEQIMEQIRARIREKRGVDYTEQQIRELANVKLEKFLDPRSVRSDLLEQFRRGDAATPLPPLPDTAFDADTLFQSRRAPLRWMRGLLRPVLKLFINVNALIQALHSQSRVNAIFMQAEDRRRVNDQLYYELVHNLVLELTRTGIEVKNLKMRIESLTGRLEFNERRARALESAVVYKPEGRPGQLDRRESDRKIEPVRSDARAAETGSPDAPQASGQQQAGSHEGPGQRSRRRRRRRGRRSGAPAQQIMGGQTGESGGVAQAPAPGEAAFEREPDTGGDDQAADDHSPEEQ